MTANIHKVVACNLCGLIQVVSPPAPGDSVDCRRCGKLLRWFKPDTRWRTGAFALATLALVPPAYFFPLASVNYLGNAHEVSMASLVARLFEMRHFFIGGFVLFTVALAPVLRAAAFYCLSVALKSQRWRSASRTLHEVILAMGPWDMAPMFLVALVVGVAKFGEGGHVETGSGALAFALMVAAARCAVAAFDSQSAWEEKQR